MGLTDLQVRKLVPRDTRFEVSDGKGLCVRVTPNGAKTWVFRYMFKHIPRRMSFGNYPGITLARARELHAQALQELQRGTDPGLKAKEEKSRIKAEPNFKELLEEFWDLELSKQPSGKDRRRLVEKDVLRSWGKRKVSSITRRDAVLLLDTVRNRAPVTANRLQGVLVRMMNFASERGIVANSPLVGMKRGKEEARARILNDDEIKALWQALDLDRKDIDIYKPTKLALKTILLVGARPGEVSGMKWEEIKDDWWIIPATRTKTREENRVPILPMVAGILEEARVYSGESPFVFASSYNEGEPLTTRAMSNAIRRHRREIGIPEFTPHDLRRTLRSKLAELGVTDIVGEKVLNHKLGGVLQIYNRYSYDDEKRQALELWEARLKKILGLETQRGKVVRLEKRRHAKI